MTTKTHTAAVPFDGISKGFFPYFAQGAAQLVGDTATLDTDRTTLTVSVEAPTAAKAKAAAKLVSAAFADTFARLQTELRTSKKYTSIKRGTPAARTARFQLEQQFIVAQVAAFTA